MRPPLIPQPMPFHGNETELVKLLKTLYNALVEYRDPQTGRILISIFMCLPSRKDFPEYFDIIKRPISMYEIQKRINNGVYQSVELCLNDFRLMFDNCRTFNEDGSMIFQDAVRLEELLFDKYDQLTSENGVSINKIKISHSPEKAPLPPKPAAPAPPSIPTSIPSTPTNNHVPNDSTKKRRLLTGYIIYAAEVRREYVDKHPNQEFGYISRLIGNDWRGLPKDLKQRYEHRALAHNAKMREKHLRDEMMAQSNSQSQFSFLDPLNPQSQQTPMTNGSSRPRLTKKRLAKMAREQARLQNSSLAYSDNDNSLSSPMRHQDRPSQANSQAIHSANRATDSPRYSYSTQQGNFGQQTSGKSKTIDAETQTAPFRFVEPATRRPYTDAENFKRYIQGLGVSNMDAVSEELACFDRPTEPVESWLGAGNGRHESTEAALWALRDFMLQDSEAMRSNMQPYLCYH